MHVCNDAGRGIHARQGFNRQNGHEERAAAAAVRLRDFNAHNPLREEPFEEFGLKNSGRVHLRHVRADLVAGEIEQARLKQQLFFAQACQREVDSFRLLVLYLGFAHGIRSYRFFGSVLRILP